MLHLEEAISGIGPIDREKMEEAWKHWDSLCKPLRGLGRLEEMVVRLAGIQGTATPECSKRAVVIMGADNGVVEEGVSQTGSEVTAQVLENMGEKKSSVCVMSRILNADVIPVNIGMNTDGRHPAVRNLAVRHGTGNIAKGPAMSREECIQAIETGISVTGELKEQGYDLVLTGEMGIGNTTTSSACAAVLFQKEAEYVTGRGAGLSSDGLNHKIQVIKQAIRVNCPDPADPLDVIAKVGGLDIAGMVGCFLGAAYYHMPVFIDGLISGIAAYAAKILCPFAMEYMYASHCSAEPAGKMVLDELGLEPLLYAGMHLGEGTGAAAVLPLLDQALNVYYGLPSFSDGKVEDYKHLK
ncbi:MAG: nicotinate-nucleotide--dimethylbenzimidazole phosphoribosyltransferase [Lachnospiraceae bacterium]|nr:nicotinate-nucleotide--dimethylbenzimidazole phosphoribosyltransferase [Lachnospiraceae bacterium]